MERIDHVRAILADILSLLYGISCDDPPSLGGAKVHDLEAGGLCLAGEASRENLLLRERAADGERFRHCTVYAVLTLFSLVSPPSRPLMSPLRPQRRCTPRALCWSSLWPDQLAESLSGPEGGWLQR